MKTIWMLISILLISLITAMFALVNTSPVRVNFMVVETVLPLIVIILASTLLGGLIVGLIFTIRLFKLRRTMKQLEKQLGDMKKDQAAAYPVPSSDSTAEAARINPVPDPPVSH